MTIYFIGNELNEVKIGFTTRDPDSRMCALQVGNPQKLSLLAQCPGSRKDEGNLHRRFTGSRIHGEWFKRTPELDQLMSTIRSAKKPRIEGNRNWSFMIEFSFSKPANWKSIGFCRHIKRLGYKSVEAWGNDVLSRELEKMLATWFHEESFPRDTAMRAIRTARYESKRLTTVDGPYRGHQLRVSLATATNPTDRFPVAVSLRRWRETGNGWIPAPAMLIFPSEIMAIGKALRQAFESFKSLAA
jgi:Meiotically up-regulated gene 113